MMRRALAVAGVIFVAAGLLLAAAAAIVACRSAEPEPSRPLNVVFIGIDTLRADHLGCYGYSRPTSPRIDALAAESALFRMAIASSPWTLPSFASMLTGLLPSHHRAGEGRPDNRTGLDNRFPTLASILQEAGWATGSFVSNGWVSTPIGLARGFDTHTLSLTDGAAELAVRFIEAHAGQPFFAFVHLLAPHAPYQPPAEDAAPFVDPEYDGPPEIGVDFKVAPASEADRRRIVDLYDGEIHYTDRVVGRILDVLARHGLTERTLIVLTADHGEELADHGGYGHGHTLYQEQLHVPLIVRFPNRRFRGEVTRQVRAFDVMPTILETLGIAPPADLDAVSLVPLLRGETLPPASERAFAEFMTIPIDQKAVLVRQEKLILTPSDDTKVLFDLWRDPRERNDRSAAMPERAEALATIIRETLVAEAAGVHVIAQNLESGDVVRVKITAPAGFDWAETSHAEGDDRLVVAPDRQRVEVEFRGSSGTKDSDGVHLQPAGTRDTVTIADATLNDAAFPTDRMLAGEKMIRLFAHPPAWTFLRRPNTMASTAWLPESRPNDGPRLIITFVSPPPPPRIEMDETLRRHLRELGYLE